MASGDNQYHEYYFRRRNNERDRHKSLPSKSVTALQLDKSPTSLNTLLENPTEVLENNSVPHSPHLGKQAQVVEVPVVNMEDFQKV